jgi:hypothetical protein
LDEIIGKVIVVGSDGAVQEGKEAPASISILYSATLMPDILLVNSNLIYLVVESSVVTVLDPCINVDPFPSVKTELYVVPLLDSKT